MWFVETKPDVTSQSEYLYQNLQTANSMICLLHNTTAPLNLKRGVARQYNPEKYSAVQFSEVQWSTVQYSVVKYSAVQFSEVQWSTV